VRGRTFWIGPGPAALAAVLASIGVTATALAHAGRGEGDARSALYVIDADGGRARAITPRGDEGFFDAPAWSPRGGSIAAAGRLCDDCDPVIYLVSPSGRRLASVPSRVTPAERPSWSPSGRRLLFIGGERSAIYASRLDGTGLVRLAGGALLHDQAAWSPDGRWIAFTRQQPNGRWDIWRMSAAGRGGGPLTRTRVSEEQPAWSPDGRRLAFIRQGPRGGWAIFTMKADGSGQRRLSTGGPNDQNPAWSPDGRRLAFVRLKGRRISLWVARGDGSRARRIATGLARSFNPAWSPDGRRIVFAGQG
jgi:Tol biopolymer transport system component